MFVLVLLLAFLGGGRGLDQDEFGLQNLQDMYDYAANDFDYEEVPVQKRQLTNDDNLMRVPDIDPEEHRLGGVVSLDPDEEADDEAKEEEEADEAKTSSHYVIHPPPGVRFNAELKHPSNPNVVHSLGFETPKTKSTVIHVHHPDPPVVHAHHGKPTVIRVPMDDPPPVVIHVHHNTAPHVIHVAQPPPVNVIHIKSNNRLRELRTRQMFIQFLKQMDAQQRLDFMSQLRAASAGNRNHFRALLNQIVVAANTRISQMGQATLESQEDMTKENDIEHEQLSNKLKDLRQASRDQASKYGEELRKTRGEVEKMRTEQQEQADEYTRKLKNLKRGMMDALEEAHTMAAQERKELEERQNKLARKHRKLKKETRECPKCGCGRKCRVTTRKVVRCSSCETPTCKKFCPQMPKQIPRKNYDCKKCDNQRCTSMCEAAAEYKSDMLVLRGILRRYTVAWKKRSAKNRKAIIAHLSQKLDFYIHKFRDRISAIKGTYERKTDVQLLLEKQNANKVLTPQERKPAEDGEAEKLKEKLLEKLKDGEAEKLKLKEKLLERLKEKTEDFGDEDDYGEAEGGRSLKNVYSMWRKRSDNRLEQLLLKAGTESKEQVEEIFQQYMERAEGSYEKWKAGVTELIKYLTTVTKVWMKKAHGAIAAEARENAEAQKAIEGEKEQEPEQEPKAREALSQPPHSLQWQGKEPYAETVYKAFRRKSQAFLKIHYPRMSDATRPRVMKYIDGVFTYARRKYLDYLSRNYPLGSRYVRRRKFLDFLKKVSRAIKRAATRGIRGGLPGLDKDSPKLGNSYVDRVYRGWSRRSSTFLQDGRGRVGCPERIRDRAEPFFAKARDRYDECSRSPSPDTNRQFLQFLTQLSRQMRKMMMRLHQGCRGGGNAFDGGMDSMDGGSGGITGQYKDWKERSEDFMRRNVHQISRDRCGRARQRLARRWRQIKNNAKRRYMNALKGRVSDNRGGREGSRLANDLERFTERLRDAMDRANDRCDEESRNREDDRDDDRRDRRRDRDRDRDDYRDRDDNGDSSNRDRDDYRDRDDSGDSSNSEESRERKKHMYGITLGWDKSKEQGDDSLGIGIETLKKRGGKWDITNPDFESDRDFKKNSYDIGVSFGHHDQTAVSEPPPN